MNRATWTPEQQAALQAEADRRVQQALDQIEAAQNMIGSACATLSSLCYANPEYMATSRMHDRVRAHWYRVRSALGRKARKIALDVDNSRAFLERTGRLTGQQQGPRS